MIGMRSYLLLDLFWDHFWARYFIVYINCLYVRWNTWQFSRIYVNIFVWGWSFVHTEETEREINVSVPLCQSICTCIKRFKYSQVCPHFQVPASSWLSIIGCHASSRNWTTVAYNKERSLESNKTCFYSSRILCSCTQVKKEKCGAIAMKFPFSKNNVHYLHL